jgi:hypothetical protein
MLCIAVIIALIFTVTNYEERSLMCCDVPTALYGTVCFSAYSRQNSPRCRGRTATSRSRAPAPDSRDRSFGWPARRCAQRQSGRKPASARSICASGLTASQARIRSPPGAKFIRQTISSVELMFLKCHFRDREPAEQATSRQGWTKLRSASRCRDGRQQILVHKYLVASGQEYCHACS